MLGVQGDLVCKFFLVEVSAGGGDVEVGGRPLWMDCSRLREGLQQAAQRWALTLL